MQGLTASQGIIGSAAGPRTPGTAYIYLHHAFGTVDRRARASGDSCAGAWARSPRSLPMSSGRPVARSAWRAEVAAGQARPAGALRGRAGVGRGDRRGMRCCPTPIRSAPWRSFPSESTSPRSSSRTSSCCRPAARSSRSIARCRALPRFKGMESNAGPGRSTSARSRFARRSTTSRTRAPPRQRVVPPRSSSARRGSRARPSPELAPDGKHTLSIFAQYAPYELAEGTWESARDEIGDRVLGTLEDYAPGLTDLVEDRLVLGPPDLEERFGLTGGNIFHGELLPDWLFEKRPASTWHRYRSPVAGLYMCGSGTHPGGGVCGAPGRNAARAVLEDLVSKELAPYGRAGLPWRAVRVEQLDASQATASLEATGGEPTWVSE